MDFEPLLVEELELADPEDPEDPEDAVEPEDVDVASELLDVPLEPEEPSFFSEEPELEPPSLEGPPSDWAPSDFVSARLSVR